ncbi:Cucumisin protein [Spatholobus suberectus]|nr:Cucumisin protein [Spatholobus suberectus]
MISLGLWHLFQILTCIMLLPQSFSEDVRKTYIVYMGDHSKDMNSIELLHTNMVQNVLGSKFAPDALLYSYKKSFNGFVARLTKEEATRMRGMDGVVSVFPNRNHKIETTESWDFLGFPQHVKRTPTESDLIVGVIDTGIWPKSDSFNDKGFGPPPQKWKGTCQNFTCNNKIVGAKYFRTKGVFGKDDISPVDTRGHGTHCASTAAGNAVGSASLFGLASGTARGGVPLARIAVYKVCWSLGCEGADILAAFDEAIADGVDILSVSMGPLKVRYPNYFEDIYAIGAFHAMKRGILMSKAAGNLGSKPFTISNNAPWFISVAASTIDRKFLTNVQLGNGKIYQGVSVNTFDLKNNSYPLIYAGDAPNITGGYNSSTSRSCPVNSLDEALVKGKIVLCDGYRGPSVGFVSGAAGVIFGSPDSKVVAKIFALPAAHLSQNDGTLVYSYIKSTNNPTATISKSYEGKDPLAPYIAPFSSRGPNKITPDILKPDLAAPGVNILAAWPSIAPISSVQGDNRRANYNILYGTSMACPHVTAAAVYIKSFHPNWSPAVIKSALMTTGNGLTGTHVDCKHFIPFSMTQLKNGTLLKLKKQLSISHP